MIPTITRFIHDENAFSDLDCLLPHHQLKRMDTNACLA